MRIKLWLTTLALMLITSLSAGSVIAEPQETTKKPVRQPAAAKKTVGEKKPAPESMDEMMAAWAKYSTPGSAHKLLTAFEGTWDTTVQMWMGPGEPNESKGTSVNKMILEGRFLHQNYDGTFMGKPFTGMGLTGFDLYKKKYVSIWVDTASTMMVYTAGTADAAGKVITESGTMDDVMTGKKIKIRTVVRMVDNNKHTFEWFETRGEEKEKKTMAITYTRKM